jgi:hypothetical protein
MSLGNILTAHESLTIDKGPSGFLLSLINEGGGAVVDFCGVNPLTVVAGSGSVAGEDSGGILLTDNSGGANTTTGVETLVYCNTGVKFAFEAKISKADVADDQGGVFVGLSTDLATATPISGNADAHALAANSIGFLIKDSDGDAIIPCVKDASTLTEKSAVALSADTFVRLGLLYDPNDSRKLRFFVDGDEVATQQDNLPASTVDLLGVVCIKSSAASADTIICDHVATAVKR